MRRVEKIHLSSAIWISSPTTTTAPPPLHPCIMFFFIAGKGVGKEAPGGGDTGEAEERKKGGKERTDVEGNQSGEMCLDTETYLSAADHGHHGPHSGRMSPPTGCCTPAHEHTSIKGVVHPRLTFCTFNTPKSSSGISPHGSFTDRKNVIRQIVAVVCLRSGNCAL